MGLSLNHDEAPYRLYGRNRARRLSRYRRNLVENLLPEIRLVQPDGSLAVDRLDPTCRIWLEIGFGGGEHLIWHARHHPDVTMVGAEPFEEGVARLLTSIDQENLGNILVHDGDIRPVISRLKDSSIERIFILFPDPWPKARHHKRRLIDQDNLCAFARLLRDGGELRIATDIEDYARWIVSHACKVSELSFVDRNSHGSTERPHDWPQTRYECKALRAGRKPVFMTLVRNHRSNFMESETP